MAAGELCPFCGSNQLRYSEPSVQCLACGATGPEGTGERSAVRKWSERHEEHGPPDVRIEETPELAGARMVLRFRTEELVVVEFVHEDYAATIRGALTLIGGMRQAEEAEEHG